MPKADAKKTKSALKKADENSLEASAGSVLLAWLKQHKRVLLYALGIIAALFALAAPSLFYQPTSAEMHVNGHTVSLEITASEAAREQGLSGRQSLPADHGMLFVFPKSAGVCLWMKDMRFSLDMVFLDQQKTITQIDRNVTPQTFPKQFCANATRYVVELNAGTAKQLGLHAGQTVNF